MSQNERAARALGGAAGGGNRDATAVANRQRHSTTCVSESQPVHAANSNSKYDQSSDWW
jgi:hypothetical protein